MMASILQYFRENGPRFWGILGAHIRISLIALAIAVLIGIPAGFLCVRHPRSQKVITGLFSVLRVIPSLAVLLLMVPLLGTGTAPAVVALVLLAVPPILMNTAAGLETVPPFMLETADGLGTILFDGLRTMNTAKILWGSLLSAVLAVGIDRLLILAERKSDRLT